MRYIIADTETTGLSAGAQVVEVALLEIDENLNTLREASTLIDPGIPIEPGASAVNGIYDADVAGKPRLADWMVEHWPQDEAVTFIAHNAPFDLRFLSPHIPVLGASLCTLSYARKFVHGSLNHKLGTLAEYLRLDKGVAHRAAGDVVTTRSLLRTLLDLSGRTLAQASAASAKPQMLQIMPFGMHKGVPVAQIPKGYWLWLDDKDLPPDVRYTVDILKHV